MQRSNPITFEFTAYICWPLCWPRSRRAWTARLAAPICRRTEWLSRSSSISCYISRCFQPQRRCDRRYRGQSHSWRSSPVSTFQSLDEPASTPWRCTGWTIQSSSSCTVGHRRCSLGIGQTFWWSIRYQLNSLSMSVEYDISLLSSFPSLCTLDTARSLVVAISIRDENNWIITHCNDQEINRVWLANQPIYEMWSHHDHDHDSELNSTLTHLDLASHKGWTPRHPLFKHSIKFRI